MNIFIYYIEYIRVIRNEELSLWNIKWQNLWVFFIRLRGWSLWKKIGCTKFTSYWFQEGKDENGVLDKLLEITFKCSICIKDILPDMVEEHIEEELGKYHLQSMVTDKKMVHGKARNEGELLG